MPFLNKWIHSWKHYRLLAPLAGLVLVCGVLIALLGGQGSPAPGPESAADPSAIAATAMDTDTSAEGAQRIDLALTPSPAIRQGGVYLLTGESSGCILVDAEEQLVHLVLQGVSVSSGRGPALYVKSAGKVVITLAAGTENRFSDYPDYPGEEDCDAALYSACDLTVNGTGSLVVSGYYQNAVHTKGVLKLLGGSVTVLAKGHGLCGNDGLLVSLDSLAVESEKSGLRTTKGPESGKGTLELAGGEITVIAGKYALDAGADLYIHDCSAALTGVQAMLAVGGERRVEEGCLAGE